MRYFSPGCNFSKRRLWTFWASCHPLKSAEEEVNQAMNTGTLILQSAVRINYLYFYNEQIMLTEMLISFKMRVTSF